MAESPGTRPACKCHDEPMYGNGPRWQCAVKARARRLAYHERHRERENAGFRAYAAAHREEHHARSDKWYWGMSGRDYNARLLNQRRTKALKRRGSRELDKVSLTSPAGGVILSRLPTEEDGL